MDIGRWYLIDVYIGHGVDETAERRYGSSRELGRGAGAEQEDGRCEDGQMRVDVASGCVWQGHGELDWFRHVGHATSAIREPSASFSRHVCYLTCLFEVQVLIDMMVMFALFAARLPTF